MQFILFLFFHQDARQMSVTDRSMWTPWQKFCKSVYSETWPGPGPSLGHWWHPPPPPAPPSQTDHECRGSARRAHSLPVCLWASWMITVCTLLFTPIHFCCLQRQEGDKSGTGIDPVHHNCMPLSVSEELIPLKMGFKHLKNKDVKACLFFAFE